MTATHARIDHHLRSQRQQLRHAIAAEHTATQDALLELVAEALTAKVSHDVDEHPPALDALDTFITTATELRASVAHELRAVQSLEDGPS